MAITASSTTTPSTTSNSGGALQSLGIGSGLDIASLVDSLTTAEMSAPNARVTRDQTAVTTQVSAMGTLKSALSTFQASLTSLLVGSGFSARTVNSGDKDTLTATATASAALGTYQVRVQQLAQSQQLLSGNFTGGANTIVGTGKLSITSSGKSFSVDIASGTTLAGIRDAINAASDNQQVSATLVYGQTGAQLVLTSLKSGANAGMSISATGGDGGLSQLTWGVGNTTHFTEKQAAQDAIISVSGVTHNSSTNQVSDAIDGVTLNLLAAKPNADVNITVGNDPERVVTLVQSFITAYNTMQTSLDPLSSYDATTQQTGPLFGDAMFTGLQQQIRRSYSNPIDGLTGNFTSLASIGITAGVDGKLTMNESKLRAALGTDFKAISNIFSGTKGVLGRLNSQITTSLLTGGAVATRNASLKTKQSDIDKQKALIDVRTAAVKERYLNKFNAMDSLLAKMNNTATYLTQQLDALNRASNNSK